MVNHRVLGAFVNRCKYPKRGLEGSDRFEEGFTTTNLIERYHGLLTEAVRGLSLREQVVALAGWATGKCLKSVMSTEGEDFWRLPFVQQIRKLEASDRLSDSDKVRLFERLIQEVVAAEVDRQVASELTKNIPSVMGVRDRADPLKAPARQHVSRSQSVFLAEAKVADKDEAHIVGEAKGVTENFIQSLGLLELILGGVGSYALWLFYRGHTPNLFPSTGTKFIDIGLLAFAAALVGKLVCLIVAAGMGLMWKIIKESNFLGYQKNLEKAVQDYQDVKTYQELTQKLGHPKPDLRALALYYLVVEDAKQQVYFERIQTKAIVAYSTCVLAILYVPYLYRAGAHRSMLTGAVLGSLLFFVLGSLEQLDYLKTLAERLIGVQTARKRKDSSRELNGSRWLKLIGRR